MDVEPNKQSDDPPTEFSGTKPSEFKSHREKVKLWLLCTGPLVLSRLTGPAWDACDGLEPEDVATADGVNVILDTLAEAFQGEHETEPFDALEDTFYGPGRKKGERLHHCALRVQSNVRELAKQGVRLPDQVQGFLLLRRANPSTRACVAIMTLAGNSLSFGDVRKACKRYANQFLRDPKETRRTRAIYSLCITDKRSKCCGRRDTDVGTALAALAEENDIDVEETDVPEILLGYKESRQLRGQQRVNRGYRPVTGRASGGKPCRVEGSTQQQRADVTCTLPHLSREGTVGTRMPK